MQLFLALEYKEINHPAKKEVIMKWLILLLSLFSNINKQNDSENVKVWTVGKESTISILGSSNVNTFAFDIKQYSGKDTLVAVQKGKQQPILFYKGTLRIPVDDFKSSNPFLTKDFKKIIKAKTYPTILMNFRNLNALPDAGVQNQRIEADVEICLAGKSKILHIPLLASRNGETIQVRGKQCLNFSDFGLVAPEKVMGFITVNNELNVNFQLALKILNENGA